MSESDNKNPPAGKSSVVYAGNASTGIGPIERKAKYFIHIWDAKTEDESIETSFHESHPNSIQSMGRRKFTHERQAVYLNHLAQYGVQVKAALVAGVSPRTVHTCAKTDPDFAEAQRLAIEIHWADAEERIKTEAINGTFDRKWDKEGRLISERRVLETRLRELILKRANPEYVETAKSEVAVTGGAVIVPAPVDSVDSWEATVAKYTGKTIDTQGGPVPGNELPEGDKSSS
jgi:hypothetical protein